MRVKADNFENNWQQMVKKGIFTHDGVQISETGLLMDAEYLRRAELIDELEQKIAQSKKLFESKKLVDKLSSSLGDSIKPKFGVNPIKARLSKAQLASLSQISKNNSVNPVMRATSLEVVSEVQDDGPTAGGNASELKSPATARTRRPKSPLRIAATNAGQAPPREHDSDQSVLSLISTDDDRFVRSREMKSVSDASAGLRSATQRGAGSGAQQLEAAFASKRYARIVAMEVMGGEDDELANQLMQIEDAIGLYLKMLKSHRIDAEEKAKKTFEQKLAKLKLELKESHSHTMNKISEQVTSQR